MAGKVSTRFINIRGNDIFNAETPSGNEWKTMAQNHNYLNGKGSQIMPTVYMSGISSYSNMTKFLFSIYTYPHAANLDKYYSIGIRPNNNYGSHVTYSVGPITNKIFYLPPSSSGYTTSSFFASEDPPSIIALQAPQSSFNENTGQTTTITLITSGAHDICHITAYEMPRSYLSATIDDNMINEDTFRVRYPIYEDSNSYKQNSVYAFAVHLSNSVSKLHRSNIFHWIRPYATGTAATGEPATQYLTSSFSTDTASTVRLSNLSATMVSRRVYPNTTSSICDFAFHARLKQGGGTAITGTIIIEGLAGSHSQQFFNLADGAATFYTGSISILCDGTSGSQMTEPARVAYSPPGSTVYINDQVGFRLQQAGSGRIDIYSITIGEKLNAV